MAIDANGKDGIVTVMAPAARIKPRLLDVIPTLERLAADRLCLLPRYVRIIHDGSTLHLHTPSIVASIAVEAGMTVHDTLDRLATAYHEAQNTANQDYLLRTTPVAGNDSGGGFSTPPAPESTNA